MTQWLDAVPLSLLIFTIDMAAFGVQFRCKIDSPARPLAPSLAVICVWQMLQGSVGTGSAQDDVRKLSKSWLAYAHEE